jgi:hypothetical protein
MQPWVDGALACAAVWTTVVAIQQVRRVFAGDPGEHAVGTAGVRPASIIYGTQGAASGLVAVRGAV